MLTYFNEMVILQNYDIVIEQLKTALNDVDTRMAHSKRMVGVYVSCVYV